MKSLAWISQGFWIETPTRKDLARLDRKRKKRTSNKEWKSPADGDARITKMKDRRTPLAHKSERTTTLDETLCEAGERVAEPSCPIRVPLSIT